MGLRTNSAVDEYNSFIEKVKWYINCINGEVKSDMGELPKILVKGAEEHKKKIMYHVRRLKSELELSRPRN